MTVLDVGELDFEREVIDRSRSLPVVVDFWAEWCGPCRQLGPLLERAAAEREGKVVLAKLDTDANQPLAQAFQIQGIPAVKAFKDARVVDEFVGAQGREAVERFFDGLLPSQADELVQERQRGGPAPSPGAATGASGRGPRAGRDTDRPRRAPSRRSSCWRPSREACGRTAWRRACGCRAGTVRRGVRGPRPG